MITAIIPVIIISLVSIVFAFIKPLDLVFEKYILFRIESLILPQKRYWLKGTGDPSRSSYIPAISKEKKNMQENIQKDDLKKKRSLTELSNILDRKNENESI